MNYLKIICSAIVLLFSTSVKAQVSVNVNIGTPPLWGPVYVEERYYYLPDVEAYYDIETSMFIYFGDGVWLHRAHLPSRYSHYDLYSGYKVVMTGYHGNTPYNDFHVHKVKYKKGYKGGHQKTIGSKPGKGNHKSNGPGNSQPKPQQKSNGGSHEKAKGGSHGNGGSHGGGKGKK